MTLPAVALNLAAFPRRFSCRLHVPLTARFPADQLRPYIKALLTAMLNGVQWDSDRARMGALSKEICEVSVCCSCTPCGSGSCRRVPFCAWDLTPPLTPGPPRRTFVAGQEADQTRPVLGARGSPHTDAQRIKQRMIEIEGRGFKFIVNTTFSENLGQAGRADMSCHWEDTDAAVQEMFSNVSRVSRSRTALQACCG